ncbi:MAG: hypothetical protein E7397_04165 [Ruminococcaceae bacterium]|nr:hypothetical protein [Oscillospiraceae bacterium]
MFWVEKDNKKIGQFLAKQIDQAYASRRQFCREYILKAGEQPDEEKIGNMSNRLSQIINGNKSIQIYDLPYFTDLLGISCEKILSAGEYSIPIQNRVTNYSIANTENPDEWERYINRADKLILNTDEYGKTIIDYALEFKNYGLLKYLIEKNYIWFDSKRNRDYQLTFGAGTSIQRRKIDMDFGLEQELKGEDALRIKLIMLAIENQDLLMLDQLRARETPQLHFYVSYGVASVRDMEMNVDEKLIKCIASSDIKVQDYFTDRFEINDLGKGREGRTVVHSFMFPFISALLNRLISENSKFAEVAIKKAMEHNKEVYKCLCEKIALVKNDKRYNNAYMESLQNRWIYDCKERFILKENGNIVCFLGYGDTFISNFSYITNITTEPILKKLIQELNASCDAIRKLKENLGEVIQ